MGMEAGMDMLLGSSGTLAGAGAAFETFGAAHLAAVAVTAAAAAGLPLWARKARSKRVTAGIGWGIAAALLANELVYYAHSLATRPAGDFLRECLPVHVCDVATYLVAWVLWTRSRRVFEVAYFWALGATLQAVLTPNVLEGFPAYAFFEFFIGHGGVVIGVIYAVFALGLRPGRGAVWRIVVITNLYLLFAAGVNWLTGANYMFLRAPPTGESPFFFLPWPWYILFLEAFGLAVVTGLYLPFWPANRRGPGRAAE